MHFNALKIRENTLGTEHPQVAQSCNNLGLLLKTVKQFKEAKIYYEKALKIYKNAFDIFHNDVAVSYHNLAQLFSESGDFLMAKQYNIESQNILMKII